MGIRFRLHSSTWFVRSPQHPETRPVTVQVEPGSDFPDLSICSRYLHTYYTRLSFHTFCDIYVIVHAVKLYITGRKTCELTCGFVYHVASQHTTCRADDLSG